MQSVRAQHRPPALRPRRWALPICVTVSLALLPLVGLAGSRSDHSVKQLSTPFAAKKQSRQKSVKAPWKRPARSNRWRRTKSPWSRAQSRRMMATPQIRTRRRAIRYGVDPDLLLRTPITGSIPSEDERSLKELGIPVISGVPPIVIIATPDRDKDIARRGW